MPGSVVSTRGRQPFQSERRVLFLDADQNEPLPLSACRQLVFRPGSNNGEFVNLRIGDAKNEFPMYPGDGWDFRDLIPDQDGPTVTGLFLTWTAQPGKSIEVWMLSHAIFRREPLS